MSFSTNYSPAVAALLTDERFLTLGPATGDRSVRAALEALTVEDIFAGKRITDRQMADGCLAALWLYCDFLDRSHEISQGIPTPEGSYWHAIMHRREGDYSNSKYWVRRVGDHPVYEQLAEAARELAGNAQLDTASKFLASRDWDPYAWVDLCEAAVRGRSSAISHCQQIQQTEWRLLFDYCYQRACPS